MVGSDVHSEREKIMVTETRKMIYGLLALRGIDPKTADTIVETGHKAAKNCLDAFIATFDEMPDEEAKLVAITLAAKFVITKLSNGLETLLED